MSIHTPGPWILGAGKGLRIMGPRGVTVANVPFTDEQGRTDAKLIAAAPEMLAALKAVLVLFEESIWIGGDKEEKCAMVQAAIAKAEGKES
ncbi:MAG: hypothetical protein Q8J78_08900 [Moraxellaceae bacterium]|nr:hypothetical protein [Moraxellaceae bacterium]